MARVSLSWRLAARAATLVLAAALWSLVGPGALPASAQTPDVPTLTQPVNDLANVIDPSSAAAMDRMIRSLQATTGDVVVVASVKTFAPYGSIEEFAVKLFERAGIGAKDKDNGVLILVAVDDRRARIEVGYGMEGFITDGFAGDVIRSAMLPAFRRNAYGEGLLEATRQVIARIAKERNVTLEDLPAPPPERESREHGSIGGFVLFVLIMLFILSRGGGRGGGSGLLWFLLGSSLGHSHRRSRGGWSGWNGGFGGGGFGGGGGGFGGFGGGGSGGGGASGSW